MISTKVNKWKIFLLSFLFTLFSFTEIQAKVTTNKKKSTEIAKSKKNTSKKKLTKKYSKKKPQKSGKKNNKNENPWIDGLKKNPNDTTKMLIDGSNPKAFTLAIMLEKKGIEFDIINTENKNTTKLKIPQKKITSDYFNFSQMLIPITHEARIGSKYGIRDHRLHRGVDVNVIKEEPIVAALPGTVIVSKYNKGGYGHYVILEHENGLQTLYGHLSQRLVKTNDFIYPGDIVGLAGNSGKSSSAHLHFEIRYGDVNIDPERIINFPKWELQKNIDSIPKKKLITEHYRMQKKLKKENVYIVKKGDTQKDVAAWFNISVDALCRLNNLKKDAPLKVGQSLKGCL